MDYNWTIKLFCNMCFFFTKTPMTRTSFTIFIIKYSKRKVCDIDVADYALIYDIKENESDIFYESFEEYSDEESVEEIDNEEIVDTIKVKLPKKNIIIKDIELDIDTNIY